jgi:hypothetical protein
MKKIVPFLLLFMAIIGLSACDDSNEVTCLSEEYYDSDTESCLPKQEDDILDVENVFEVVKTKKLVDHADMYDLESKEITVYENESFDGVSFVTLRDFLSFTEDGLLEYSTMQDGDVFQVKFEQTNYFTNNLDSFYLRFDPIKNTVYVSDFEVFHMMNAGVNIEYYTSLYLENISQVNDPTSVSIELDDYGMIMMEEDGEIYMPFYLANLFLSGSTIEYYEQYNQIVALDFGEEFTNFKDSVAVEGVSDLSFMGQQTEGYLRLLFDYFYGINDIEGKDYSQLIKDMNLSESTSLEEHYITLNDFLFDLDDLHTGFVYSGKYNPDFEYEYTPIEGSRLDLFTAAYEYNACETRTEEFSVERSGSILYLTVNGFTFETVDYINEVPLRDGDTMIIDLSCNSGGSLLGMIELVTLLTNNDIYIENYNPVTGVYTISQYDTYVNRAHNDVTVYVITSPVTFSAGNLFASIVQDYDLGTVIGEDTSGGAAAIDFAVLPDGSIIVYSSNFVLTDINNDPIEYGIEADIPIDIPVEKDKLLSGMDSLFEYMNDFETSMDRIGNDISVSYSEISMDEDLSNLTYYFSIRDLYNPSMVWITEEYTGDFVRDFSIDYSNMLYEVVISVEYTYQGMTFKEDIASFSFDDHPDEMGDQVKFITLENTVTAGKYERWDDDFFGLSITEAGTYRITLDHDLPTVYLFDTDFNEIEFDGVMILEPGDYYVKVVFPTYETFEVGLELLPEDDNEGSTPITLTSGLETFDVLIDYSFDKEQYSITIEQQTLLTIELNLDENDYYTLGQAEYWPTFEYTDHVPGNESITVLLNPGTYQLYVVTERVGTVTLTTVSNTEINDYDGNIYSFDETSNIGTLEFGENTIVFEAPSDVDIYKLVIEEATYVMFSHNNEGVLYYYLSNVYNSYHYDVKLYEPGTYYFTFNAFEGEYYQREMKVQVFALDISEDTDDYVPIELDTDVAVVSISEDDLDYYTFTIEEIGQYEIYKSNRYVTYYLYDTNLEFVREFRETGVIVLEPGTYTIKVEVSSFRSPAMYTKLKISEIEDDNISYLGLDSSEYKRIIVDGETITGNLEFAYDKDVFVFVLEEAKNLYISVYS